MNLKQMIDKLAELDAHASELMTQAKAAKAEAAAFEYQVYLQMEEEGFDVGDDIKHKGVRWGRQVDYYAKIQDEREFNEWAEANAPHLIKPKASQALLNQLVVQAHEDGTELPPGIGEWPKLWVSKRAA